MRAFRRSICHHLFDAYDEGSIRTTFEALSAAGFDAIELLGEPSFYPTSIKDLVQSSGLDVSAITAASRIATGRDLVHGDPAVRSRTRAHLRRCAQFAADLDCDVVGVALTAVGRFRRDEDGAAELARLNEALDWLDMVAKEVGVVFAIEVLNRYSSAYLNSPISDVEVDWRRANVRLTLDTFHLLTELRAAREVTPWAPDTANIQVSGGARGGVGRSLVDPGIFVAALADGGYRGPVTLEAFQAGTGAFTDSDLSDPEPVMKIAREFITWCDAWDSEWQARADASDPLFDGNGAQTSDT